MVYLFYENTLTNKARVNTIYYVTPPEEMNNLPRTAVENLPDTEVITGKMAVLYCNPEDGSAWYEYVDVPKSETQLLREENLEIKLALAELAEIIAGGAA